MQKEEGKEKIAATEKLPEINANAAGIDIGSEKIFISTGDNEVKSFETYTQSYQKAIEYMKLKNVRTIAMEATGVYWVAFYEMLEEAGFEVCVVNGRQAKNVPGRKTDVLDCQWIRTLHSYGLLRASFIPSEQIRTLRSYIRHRDDNIRMGAQHIQHIQKALELMNIKLTNVITHITGASGLKVIKAILGGERNQWNLLKLCDKSIQDKKSAEFLAALKGNYKKEHLFLLKQALESWEFYQNLLKECDQQIAEQLQEMTKDKNDPGYTGQSKINKAPNRINIDGLHQQILKLTDGRDAEIIVGFSDTMFLQLISELGFDLSAWKTEKHFASWLGLAPPQNKSGKGSRPSKGKKNTKVGGIFRIAVRGIAKSKDTALSGFYHRLKSKHGPKVAFKATARKLAVLFYNTMTKGIPYVEAGLKKYQEDYENKKIEYLKKQAARYKFSLVPAAVS